MVNKDIDMTNELIDQISHKIIDNENAIMEKRVKILDNVDKMNETVTVIDYDSNGNIIGSHEEPKYNNELLEAENMRLEEEIESLKSDNKALEEQVYKYNNELRNKDNLINRIKMNISLYENKSFEMEKLYQSNNTSVSYDYDDNNNIIRSYTNNYNDQGELIGYTKKELDKEKVLSTTSYNNKGEVLSETIYYRDNSGNVTGSKIREFDYDGYLKATIFLDESGKTLNHTYFYRNSNGDIEYTEKYDNNNHLLQVDTYDGLGNLNTSANYDNDGYLTILTNYNNGLKSSREEYVNTKLVRNVLYDTSGNVVEDRHM